MGAIIRPNMIKKSSGFVKGGGKGQSWSPGGRKGGGKSSGGGEWLFVPSFGKGKAKGKGKSKGKGKGKGMDKKTEQWNRTMDKLNKIDADQKVWVGGLSEKTTWKTLEKHFEESGGVKPKITEIMKAGTACCAFKDAEEAQSAIASLNGSELEGKDIEVDVWTEKEKKTAEEKKAAYEDRKAAREDRPKRKAGAAFGKGSGKANKQGGKFDKTVDPSLKVWIGGLAEKTSPGGLMKHFSENGCKAEGASLMKAGTACLTFKTDDDASSALGLTATELDGNTIEVDVWTKPEKVE